MNLMTKILIPVEDMKFGEAQIDFLAKHELPAETEFTLMTVITPLVVQDYGFAVPSTYLDIIVTEDEKRARKLLNELEGRLKKRFPSGKITLRVAMGAAAGEILHEAKEEAHDWIVMGSHGRTGWDKFLLGSVSQAVVNRAHCSVTVVRKAEQEAASEEEQEAASAASR